MHDNHAHWPDAFFTLPGQSVLEVVGPDALAFVQAQCMNDVTLLADAQWQWNGWLTPQGRVVALFALLRRDAQTVWLILPHMPAQRLAEAWQRFVFRAKLKLIPREDLRLCGRFAASASARGALADLGDEVASLDVGGDGGPREWRIARNGCGEDDAAQLHWRAMDLRHGLPRLDAMAEPRWTPQQLLLERLKAYSVKKGCYPGQEIVARTHFLGQAKRGLMLLRSDRPLAVGATVSDGEGRGIGEVICTADDIGLSVASLDSQPATVGGEPVELLAFENGLAR